MRVSAIGLFLRNLPKYFFEIYLKSHFLVSGRDHVIFLEKPPRDKIKPDWILLFMTLVETMGSVVFTWGALGAIPIYNTLSVSHG